MILTLVVVLDEGPPRRNSNFRLDLHRKGRFEGYFR